MVGKDKIYSPLNDLAGRFTPYFYLAPTFLMTAVFLIYPLLGTLYFSFVNWEIGSIEFVGFKNYLQLLSDPRFWTAFKANLIYILFFSLIPAAFGLIIASIIGRGELRFARFYRTVFFLPQVLASVVIGIIFGWIYAPQFGVIKHILDIIGAGSYQQAWLGSTGTAPVAVGLIGTWIWTGFCVILFLTGIQKIDESIYEAAKIDGASSAQQFFHITLPDLRFEISVALVVTLIRSLSTNVFGIVDAATGGAYQTRPISLYAYQVSFVQGNLGYGSAIVIILAILVMVLSRLIILVSEQGEYL